MKSVITILGVLSISLSSFASVSIEDTEPMYSCIKKAEKTLSGVAAAAGLGQGVVHAGGMVVTSVRQYAEGGTVYVLGGGVLSAENIDGYLTGTGAQTLVKLTKKSCNILSIQLTTGKSPQVNLGSKFTTQK